MIPEAEPIVCRVTPWYHKRRVAMLVLIFGFSIYFFYDWKVGYPLKREAAETMVQLEKENRAGEYDAIAKEKGWPSKAPDTTKNWDYAVKEQLFFACLTAGIGMAMLYFYIRTVRGTLSADATSFSTSEGHHVPFASAFRIDRRKWDHKGLAYVFYKDAQGRDRRAVIDDLIFGGAVKVLDRLQANFTGEVIDLEKKDTPPSAAEIPPKEEEEKESQPTPAQ